MSGTQNPSVLAILSVYVVYGFLQGYVGGAAIRFVMRLALTIMLRLFLTLGINDRRPSPALRTLIEGVTYSVAGGLGIVLTLAPALILFSLPFLPRHRYSLVLWVSALMAGLLFYQIKLQRR